MPHDTFVWVANGAFLWEPEFYGMIPRSQETRPGAGGGRPNSKPSTSRGLPMSTWPRASAQWQDWPSATGGWHRGPGTRAACCWQSPQGTCPWCFLLSAVLPPFKEGRVSLPCPWGAGSGVSRGLPDQSWLEKFVFQPHVLAAHPPRSVSGYPGHRQ